LPGVKEFLAQAKEKNIPCAIASASKNAPFILDKLGVMSDFATIVDPATLKKGKPDPEIFVQASLHGADVIVEKLTELNIDDLLAK